MDDNKYKLDFKFPSCLSSPWSYLIPFKIRKETLLKIKNECIDIYGEDLTEECSKRLVCLTKTCLGRQIPWKSPTAKPYLDLFAKRFNLKEDDDFFVSTCGGCPIKTTCTKTCPMVNDFNKRNTIQEPKMFYNETLLEKQLDNLLDNEVTLNSLNNLKLPWDCLTEDKVNIVKTYLFEQRDFLYVAEKFNLNNQARAKYEFYASLTRLSEFGVIRKFLEERSSELTDKQLTIFNKAYIENLPLNEIAKQLLISNQAVSNSISRVIDNYNIKWTHFVRKKNDKVIYNIPEILK